MGAFDQQIAAWRNDPTAELTIGLCTQPRTLRQPELVREVGACAQTWHVHDVRVLLAVGRLYQDAGLLPEAQTTFVNAGKADAADADAFRALGEVLLRRGDAARAEKVLARATDLGATDDSTRALRERAAAWVPLQKRVGAQGLAREVARALPGRYFQAPIGASANSPRPVRPEPASLQRGLPRAQSRESGEAEEISEVYEREETALRVPPEPAQAGEGKQSSFGSASRGSPPLTGHSQKMPIAKGRPRLPSEEDVTDMIVDVDRLPSFADLVSVDLSRAAPNSPRLPSFEDDVTTINAPPYALARFGPAKALQSRPGALRVAPSSRPPPSVGPSTVARSPGAKRQPAPPTRPAQWTGQAAVGNAAAVLPVPQAPASPLPPAPRTPSLSSVPRGAQTETRLPPSSGLPSFADADFRSSPAQLPPLASETALPSPSLVLAQLASVGIYEPSGGAAPAWEAAPPQRTRGIVTLLVGIVLLGAAGGGAYEYARRLKHERAERARALNQRVEKLLHSGRVADLKATDAPLSQAFDLDSLSRRSARLWLENRVLGALLLSGEPRGIDSAVYRGRSVGLSEKELAAGRVASALVDGDLAGAAALLPKWDAQAGKDALYQLASGAVLERAGDGRALERYASARNLDSRLLPADMLLVRLLLLEGGVERARTLLQEFAQKTPDPASLRALLALAWVVDPARPATLPESAELSPKDALALPRPLAAIPAMVQAAQARARNDLEAASTAVSTAIELAETPALATSLGFLAIEAGNEQLARKAALRALSFAALYPRARTLAARVALLGGRIDEAQKAIEELDPNASDVAVVRAVVAYELAEAPELTAAVDALGPGTSDTTFAALSAAPGVLLGVRYPSPEQLEVMASPLVPWGEIVAADAALDSGNLELAERLLARRNSEVPSPVHLSRTARLRRYQSKPSEAAAASEAAMRSGRTRPLLIERTYELLDAGELPAAKELLEKYPSLLGPNRGWLSVLVDIAAKQPAQARLRLTELEPPPEGSPVFLRVLAARALAAAEDKRARPYLGALLKKLPRHPDLLLAAQGK